MLLTGHTTRRKSRESVVAGFVPADTDVVAVGKTLFAVVPGFLVQRLVLGDFSPEELRRGVRALTRESMLTRRSDPEKPPVEPAPGPAYRKFAAYFGRFGADGDPNPPL